MASAILGLTVVVGLETIDASIRGGQKVVHQAWAQCMVRETASAILHARWAAQYPAPDRALSVGVAGPADPARDSVQKITITARDPISGSVLYSASFLKAAALQGDEAVDSALPGLAPACPRP